LKLRFANGKTERLASMAEDFVTEKVDVIAAVGTDASLAAQLAAVLVRAHSPTSATGTGWEHTRWHATQRAAWEALRKAGAAEGEPSG
jgi:hypothetical protein